MNNTTTAAAGGKCGRVADRAARIIASVILAQTLFFKFTGAPESVYIFTTVGQEPWGRYGSGVVELIACVLLFIPGLVSVGAALALGVMSGAIFFHLTKLGIVVKDDGGTLFALAIMTALCAAFVLWRRRRELPLIGGKL
jgi:putative oxidoreductase